MGKNVLIVSTSPRVGSNSDLLANEFGRGAKYEGNEVEIISLKDKDIKFCKGCFACQKTQRCVIRDDADLIEQKMRSFRSWIRSVLSHLRFVRNTESMIFSRVPRP